MKKNAPNLPTTLSVIAPDKILMKETMFRDM